MRRLFLLLALTSTACGSYAGGGGGGGFVTIGGAPGAACAPEVHAQGCNGVEKVSCDAASSTWQSLGSCGANQACVGEPDPADPSSGKLIAKCVDVSSSGGGGTTDTVAAGDGGGSSGGGTDGGATDSGSTTTDTVAAGDTGAAADTTGPTGGPWLTCAKTKCGAQWSGCELKANCKTAALCFDACGSDKACSQLCVDNTAEEEQSALIAVLLCAEQMGCVPAENKCGDGKCAGSETASTCPQDCKAAGPKCGDGKCESPENAETCSQDCKPAGPVCGNGKCEDGESSNTCPQDCKPAVPQCGDGKCEGNETPQTCLADCKPTCGDGKCELGESKNTCPQDCGPKTVCGNNVCEPGETASSCPKDCAPKPTCGDGKCESGETASTCPQDCGGGGATCLQQKCSSQLSACENDTKCVAIVYYGALANCADTNKCTDANCVQTKCGQESSQCQSFAGCSSLLQCLQNCSSGNQTCANNCFGASAMSKYESLAKCSQTNCP